MGKQTYGFKDLGFDYGPKPPGFSIMGPVEVGLHMDYLLNDVSTENLLKLINGMRPFHGTPLQNFRFTETKLRDPGIRAKMKQVILRNELTTSLFGALWIHEHRDIWDFVATNDAKEIKKALPDLVEKYGETRVRLAIGQDNRWEVLGLTAHVTRRDPGDHREDAFSKMFESRERNEAAEQREMGREEEIRQLRVAIRNLEKELEEARRPSEESDRMIQLARAEARTYKEQLAAERKHTKSRDQANERLRRTLRGVEESKARLLVTVNDLKNQVEALERRTPVLGSTWNVSDRSRWEQMFYDALRRNDRGSVNRLCAHIQDTAPSDPDARILLYQFYGALKNDKQRIFQCLWIADYYRKQGERMKGCEWAFKALRIDPRHLAAQDSVRQSVAAISLNDKAMVSGIRDQMEQLLAENPKAGQAARKLVAELGKAFEETLLHAKDEPEVDRIVDLDSGDRKMRISIGQMLAAVHSNDVKTVEFVRRSLGSLLEKDAEEWRSVVGDIQAADPARAEVILGSSMPVLVDGSNVAWEGRVDSASLGHLLEMREELWASGYFPVLIYADSTLGEQIDDAREYRAMVNRGEVIVVKKGQQADRELVGEAKKLRCAVVTNDLLRDWDPACEVGKIRYSAKGRELTLRRESALPKAA